MSVIEYLQKQVEYEILLLQYFYVSYLSTVYSGEAE